jgi:hypothetical protein
VTLSPSVIVVSEAITSVTLDDFVPEASLAIRSKVAAPTSAFVGVPLSVRDAESMDNQSGALPISYDNGGVVDVKVVAENWKLYGLVVYATGGTWELTGNATSGVLMVRRTRQMMPANKATA